MGDIKNGSNIITDKCIRISKRFIRSIDRNGIMINLVVLKSTEPTNQYELLYGQSEMAADKDLQFKAVLMMNPPEQAYKDLHMEYKGNALLGIMSYSMQLVGLIDGSLLGYLSIPRQLLGNHVRIGNDYYRIDEVAATSVFQGFPLYHACSLSYIETKP